jgi:hypothetical protein
MRRGIVRKRCLCRDAEGHLVKGCRKNHGSSHGVAGRSTAEIDRQCLGRSVPLADASSETLKDVRRDRPQRRPLMGW